MTITANLWTLDSVVREWLEKRDLSRRKIAFLQNAYKQLHAKALNGEWELIPADIWWEAKTPWSYTWGRLVQKILEKVSPNFDLLVDGVVDLEGAQYESGFIHDLLQEMEEEQQEGVQLRCPETCVEEYIQLQWGVAKPEEKVLTDHRIDFLDEWFEGELSNIKELKNHAPETCSEISKDYFGKAKCVFVGQSVALVLDIHEPRIDPDGPTGPSLYDQVTKVYIEA